MFKNTMLSKLNILLIERLFIFSMKRIKKWEKKLLCSTLFSIIFQVKVKTFSFSTLSVCRCVSIYLSIYLSFFLSFFLSFQLASYLSTVSFQVTYLSFIQLVYLFIYFRCLLVNHVSYISHWMGLPGCAIGMWPTSRCLQCGKL